jgi:hypothetical protein
MECPALGCTMVATGAQRSTRLGEQAPSTRRDKDRPAVARVRSRPHRGIRGSWRIGANESQPWRRLTGGAEERSSALPESAVFEAGVLLLLPLRRAPGPTSVSAKAPIPPITRRAARIDSAGWRSMRRVMN